MMKNRFLVVVSVLLLVHGEESENQEVSTHHHESLLLQNVNNSRYLIDVEFGTPFQKFNILIDTGSHELWIPSKDCQYQNDQKSINKFDYSSSSTFKRLSDAYEVIEYAGGESVKGKQSEDVIKFNNIEVIGQFLLVDQSKMSKKQGKDGLIGLSPNQLIQNIFDLGYSKKKLASPFFGFKVGHSFLKQDSFLYYNLTQDQFPDVFEIESTSRAHWMVPIVNLSIDFLTYNVSEMILDTGAPGIYFTQEIYKKIMKNNFNDNCLNYQDIKLCDCNYDNYPTITVEIGRPGFKSQQFKILSRNYLTKFTEDYCQVRIMLEDEVSLLGVPFFEGRTILFDKERNTIKLGLEETILTNFVKYPFIIYFLDFFQVLFVLLSVGLIFKPDYSSFGTRLDHGTEMNIK